MKFVNTFAISNSQKKSKSQQKNVFCSLCFPPNQMNSFDIVEKPLSWWSMLLRPWSHICFFEKTKKVKKRKRKSNVRKKKEVKNKKVTSTYFDWCALWILHHIISIHLTQWKLEDFFLMISKRSSSSYWDVSCVDAHHLLMTQSLILSSLSCTHLSLWQQERLTGSEVSGKLLLSRKGLWVT